MVAMIIVDLALLMLCALLAIWALNQIFGFRPWKRQKKGLIHLKRREWARLQRSDRKLDDKSKLH